MCKMIAFPHGASRDFFGLCLSFIVARCAAAVHGLAQNGTKVPDPLDLTPPRRLQGRFRASWGMAENISDTPGALKSHIRGKISRPKPDHMLLPIKTICVENLGFGVQSYSAGRLFSE